MTLMANPRSYPGPMDRLTSSCEIKRIESEVVLNLAGAFGPGCIYTGEIFLNITLETS